MVSSSEIACTSFFKALFSRAPTGILVVNHESLIASINKAALNCFGYSEKELLQQQIETIIPSWHSAFNYRPLKGFHARRSGASQQLNCSAKNGKTFLAQVEVSGSYNDNEEGRVLTIFFVRPLTKDRDSSSGPAGLAASPWSGISTAHMKILSKLQRTLLDTAGAIIITTDAAGIITFFNHEAECKLGYAKAEVIGKLTPVIFHSRKDIIRARKELDRTFHSRPSTPFSVLVEKSRRDIHNEEQYSYISKSGSSFPVSLTITALRDDRRQISGYLSIAIDISERVKAVQELKQTRHLFFQLLENYPDGSISIVDRNLNFVYTGGELHKILHSDIRKLPGREMFPRFPAPLRKVVATMLESVFAYNTYISDFQLPLKIKDGIYCMDAFPLFDESGVVQNAGVVIKNISKLKKAEEELRHALKEEQSLSELKSRFVSLASHEFRTRLSTILSSAYLIEQYTTTDGQEAREKHLQRILVSVKTLTDILNEFLDLGKIEEGKVSATYSYFDIERMMRNTLDEIRPNLPAEQEIIYQHAGGQTVMLDQVLLKAIVLNLVSNAGKFSKHDDKILVTTVAESSRFQLIVKDKGIGISKADQKHLTNRFFRGTNAAGIQGTGLGLHIVSKYTEMMNGAMAWESQPDAGTTFTVTFKTENFST